MRPIHCVVHKRRVALALLPAALVLLSFLLGLRDWHLLGVPGANSLFGDLRTITVTADCITRDAAWSIASQACSGDIPPYNYPSIWAWVFSRLGLGETRTLAVAVALTALLSLTAFALTYVAIGVSARPLNALLMSLAFLTPPVFLALERGNVDIAVLALVVLSLLAAATRHSVLAGVGLGLATIVKLFPIGSAIALAQTPGRRVVAWVSFTITVILGLAVIVGDLGYISSRTPRLDGASFGASLLPMLVLERLSLPSPSWLELSLGFLIFGAVTLAFLFWDHRYRTISNACEIALMRDRSIPASLFLGGTGAYVVSYVLGPSFDYRLIFLLPVVTALISLSTRKTLSLVSLILCTMTLSYSNFVPALLQYLADVGQLLLVPVLISLAVALLRDGRKLSTSKR